MRLLLATDGSKHAFEAARQCRKFIANFDKAVVKIITVLDNYTPMATEPFITPEEFMISLEKELRETAERIIEATADIVRAENKNIPIEREILIGSAKKVIVKDARKWGADLIIVGSHGRGFWGRALLGSVSDAVVHQASCSVLVIKRPEDEASDENS